MPDYCEERSKLILTDSTFLEMATKESYMTLPFNSNDTDLNLNVLPWYNFMTLGNKIIPGRL